MKLEDSWELDELIKVTDYIFVQEDGKYFCVRFDVADFTEEARRTEQHCFELVRLGLLKYIGGSGEVAQYYQLATEPNQAN